jgi:Ni/Co efflux regulator RcnB
MNRMIKALALSILGVALTGLPAFSQDHPDQDRHDQAQSRDRHDNGTYRHHDEWKKGFKIQHEDWNRGDKVDYRQNHLRRPPEGHEWRQIDGNYVLANRDGRIVSTQPTPAITAMMSIVDDAKFTSSPWVSSSFRNQNTVCAGRSGNLPRSSGRHRSGKRHY